MSQLKAYSLLTGDVTDVGEPTEDIDTLLGLADLIATHRPSSIVFIEGNALQKWEDADE